MCTVGPMARASGVDVDLRRDAPYAAYDRVHLNVVTRSEGDVWARTLVRVLETIEPRIDGEVDENSEIDGRVVIETGAKVVGSRVRGPAIIGPGTVIEDTYIGPFTAIAEDCVVTNSEVEHSVVLRRSVIENVPRLTDSLIGRDAEIRRSGGRPAATRLMIGDHCSIDLE